MLRDEDSRSYRFLLVGLGILWIMDGILQMQPGMFTRGFVTNVLSPVMSGQPSWVVSLMQEGIHLWMQMFSVSNMISTLIQLLIGVLLLCAKGTVRIIGLYLSLLWALIVWAFAEGFGGIFAGSPTILTGAPGSALFYAIASILLLLPSYIWSTELIRRFVRYLGSAYLLLATLWQALPSSGYFQSANLAGIFTQASQLAPQPGFLVAALSSMAYVAAQHTIIFNIVFSSLLAIIAVLWFAWNRSFITLLIALALCFAIWLFGQDFGIFGGFATDVNSAPIFGLLLIVGWLNGQDNSVFYGKHRY